MFASLTLCTEIDIRETGGMYRNLDFKVPETGQIGVIPVYETREQAEMHHPGHDVISLTTEDPHKNEKR